MYFHSLEYVMIYNSKFIKNEAFKEGGVIYYTIENFNRYGLKDKFLHFENNVFYENFSPVGNIGRIIGLVPILDTYGEEE